MKRIQTISVIGSDITKSLEVRKPNTQYTGEARTLLGAPKFPKPAR
jgi:hypothetical protein